MIETLLQSHWQIGGAKTLAEAVSYTTVCDDTEFLDNRGAAPVSGVGYCCQGYPYLFSGGDKVSFTTTK